MKSAIFLTNRYKTLAMESRVFQASAGSSWRAVYCMDACLRSQVLIASQQSRVLNLSFVRSEKFEHRVLRIHAFAGEGDSDKGENSSSSSGVQENGQSGSAVAGSSSPSSTKLGFGASTRPGPGKSSKEKKKAATIRRSAPEQPLIQAPGSSQSQQIETAYVVSLSFLGVLIFMEGIALAASGFLPEEWDQFFVDTVYPSFTPTVGLFLAGAAGYGILKYLGGPPTE